MPKSHTHTNIISSAYVCALLLCMCLKISKFHYFHQRNATTALGCSIVFRPKSQRALCLLLFFARARSRFAGGFHLWKFSTHTHTHTRARRPLGSGQRVGKVGPATCMACCCGVSSISLSLTRSRSFRDNLCFENYFFFGVFIFWGWRKLDFFPGKDFTRTHTDENTIAWRGLLVVWGWPL